MSCRDALGGRDWNVEGEVVPPMGNKTPPLPFQVEIKEPV